MKNESIEFQVSSGEKEVSNQFRGGFRVPISDIEPVWSIIKQKKYLVSDINLGGIGIYSDAPIDCKSGEILPDCELRLGKLNLDGLTGRIIHCSPIEPGRLQYGIEWVDIRTDQKEALNSIISQKKKQALKDSNLDESGAQGVKR
jgi:hypothetical protein